jgi:hypothetical protein
MCSLSSGYQYLELTFIKATKHVLLPADSYVTYSDLESVLV